MKLFTKGKYFVYPLVLLVILLLLSVFKINGSSVEIFSVLINEEPVTETKLLFGRPRAIRSDSFLVNLPIITSQDINKEPLVNTKIGEGTNLGTNYFPSKEIFSLFRPTFFMFYLFDNTPFSYSFYWWAEVFLALISVYFLLLELTKKDIAISIIGSLLFLFSPFTQWWNHFSSIAWISLGVFFFLRLLNAPKIIKSVFYGLGLIYSMIAFSLTLYPPFQIPLIHIALAIAIGYVIYNWANIKKNFKKSLPVLLAVILITGVLFYVYIATFKDVINITTNTIYPGKRFITAGDGNPNLLFSGFYNILLQKDLNTAPFENQSESSNFFLLFPPIIIWVIYKNIILFKKKKKLDWIAITLSSSLLFFLAFYFLPVPKILSQLSFMYLVPHSRLLIGFGYASYLLMLYVLSKDIYLCQKNWIERTLAALLSIAYGAFIFITGKNIYNISPDFFLSPKMISPIYKIIITSLFVVIILILLFKQHKKLFLSGFFLFSFVSTFFINPIYQGLDVLIKTELAEYISTISTQDDSKWVAYDKVSLAQYALANNANMINGVHLYPQFEIWKVLDPTKEYIDVYNRYAHVHVSEYDGEGNFIKLLYPDVLVVNISPCDSKWEELNVKYVITPKSMEYECLTLLKEFSENKVYIYEIQ